MRQYFADGFSYDDSVAHPVTFRNSLGHTFELHILADNVIKVRHSLGKDAIMPPAAAGCQFQTSVHTEGQEMTVETNLVRVSIKLPQFLLAWYSKETGECFSQDCAVRAYAYNDKQMWHYRKRFPSDRYVGLGERTGNLVLNGRRFRVEPRTDSMGYDAESQDPLYKYHPVLLTLNKRITHGLYYSRMGGAVTFDLNAEFDAMWGPYSYYQIDGAQEMEYMMVYGPTVREVVRSMGLLLGGPRHLYPRFSFGYLASSMTYADAPDAQAQIEGFADKLRKYDIPCDGFHLSSGYTLRGDDRCVFTWDRQRFPDPEGLARKLKEQGIYIFANVKPWLLRDAHPDYEEVKRKRGFVWQSDHDVPNSVYQWRGGEHTMGEGSYVDLTSEAGYGYWQERLASQLVDKGYMLWLDNNEFTLLDDEKTTLACEVPPRQYDLKYVDQPWKAGAGPRISHEIGASAWLTLMMVQASYEVVRKANPNERPFMITRSTVPYCQQLVSQTWSGDNRTDWKTIRYNTSMGVGAALCGVPAMYGHDVGGFAGRKPEPELLVRWIQQGILWPRFCIHSWNDDHSITEPWSYEETLPVIRSSIHFRYKLIPFLYSLHVTEWFRQCEPLVRPVFYTFDSDQKTHDQGFEFMLGPDMLVAPVSEPGHTTREVYLPNQTAWYHFQSGKYFNGGETVTVPSTTADYAAPIFMKAGSLLPLGRVMNSVHAQPDSERRVQIFPERNNAARRTFTLIEDDGKTLYHETGKAYTEVHIWMEADADEIRVGLDIINDGYIPDYDTIWVTCPIQTETRPLRFMTNREAAVTESLPRMVDDDDMFSYYGLPAPWKKTA